MTVFKTASFLICYFQTSCFSPIMHHVVQLINSFHTPPFPFCSTISVPTCVLPSVPFSQTDQCCALPALYVKLTEPPACSRTVLPPYRSTTNVKSLELCPSWSAVSCYVGVARRLCSVDRNFSLIARLILLLLLRCRLV
jgi:hypothetical protein